MRAAIYYAPDPADPLWTAAASWLGRDAETGATRPQPLIDGIAGMTAAPAAYGFHATLKPPMRIGTSYDQLLRDVADLAAETDAFDLPLLAVRNVKGFLALQETGPSQPLHDLADACVTRLDPHRAPPSADELARRRHAALTPEQDAMLVRWGYPYVLSTWFFHMTLTRRLSDSEHVLVHPAATAHLAEALARPRRVEALTVFTQRSEDAPFLVAERLPLRQAARAQPSV